MLRENLVAIKEYIIYNFKNVEGEYLYYYMQIKFKHIIEQYSAKSTVDSVRLFMLQNFNILIPSTQEQNNIISHIKNATVRIDKVISFQQRMLALLQERKQIIINDVVTGKVKVS